MDEKPDQQMRRFGLLGKNISYSFSKGYFETKFKQKAIENASYENFDIENIKLFKSIFKKNANIKGLNVTIPYKEAVIPYLDKLNKKAKKIGAVNTIKITKKGKLIGYNTDYYGFKNSLKPHLKPHHKKALILGTGGASKAVAFALQQLNIEYKFVSRNVSNNSTMAYNNLLDDHINNASIIINCTPLGTFPNVKQRPEIPYHAINNKHILFDLIYNPEETTFLKLGKSQGATIINGYNMLVLQAEKSWSIWNK
ncbi:shikimate dehydrogenase family protein [Lacinutrix salivirga]